jgi:hypothetical protein
MMADLTEQGSGMLGNYSRAPHTNAGLKKSPLGVVVPPINLGLEGCNVATPDCSVQWKKAANMLPHTVSPFTDSASTTQSEFLQTYPAGILGFW